MKKILLVFLMLLMSACNANTSQHNNSQKIVRQDHDYIYNLEDSDEQKQIYQIFAISPRTDINYFCIYHFELEPHDKPYTLTINLRFKDKEKKINVMDIPSSQEKQVIMQAYDQFVLKTAFIENGKIIKQQNNDINDFVGYKIKASASNPITYIEETDLNSSKVLYEVEFYINDINIDNTNIEPDKFYVTIKMEV